MGLPIIVEIAIGLAFIYLILSLLASEIQELIGTILQWRAKHLKDSIINLFTGDVHSNHSVRKAQQLTKQIYQHPLIQGINQESRGLLPKFFRSITWVISSIYQAIAGKKEGEFNDQKTAPSYISREAFSTSLLEQLGTKHFVERLVEAKFSRFVGLVEGKLEGVLELSGRKLEQYKNLQEKFQEIEDEFIDKKIDLDSAINSVSQRLDIFLRQLQKKSDSVDQAGASKDEAISKELQEWKIRFFVEKLEKSNIGTEQIIKNANTEQIIKNFGLSPNLQEIVESIDKGSKVYNTYKQQFQKYDQNRLASVHADLTMFENFLSGFLKGMVEEFYSGKKENFLQQWLREIETLDTEFLTSKDDASTQTFDRSKRPLSEINEVILKKLDECLNGIESLEGKNGAAQKLKYSLKAFREGFAGKKHRFNLLRHIWVFRASIVTKVGSFGLFLTLGFFIFAGLSNLSLPGALSIIFSQQRLLGRWGGAVFLSVLILSPLLLYRALQAFFAWRKQVKKRRWYGEVIGADAEPKKPLAGIFDSYFASDEFSINYDNSPDTHIDVAQDEPRAKALQAQKTKFSQEISQRLREISEEQTDLYGEMKDLGRSFRRYYLRFLLENADIDLAFIPSSVKQSLAVLIRRSKTSAKQAEDQILYLKEEVEAWYDRSMERASGVYKRNAKGISILIGVVLAIAVNANSIHILDQLAFDQELRETVALRAENLVEQIDSSDGLSEEEQDSLSQASQLLDDMDLPIGWDPDLIGEEFKCEPISEDNKNQNNTLESPEPQPEASSEQGSPWNTLFKDCLYETADEVTQSPDNFFPPTAIAAIFLADPLVGLKFLLGWTLTGIAISMGASFWFDLLSKLVKVRNTGKQLSTSSAESDTQKVTDT